MNEGTIGSMRRLGVTESYKLKRQVVLSASEAAEMILRYVTPSLRISQLLIECVVSTISYGPRPGAERRTNLAAYSTSFIVETSIACTHSAAQVEGHATMTHIEQICSLSWEGVTREVSARYTFIGPWPCIMQTEKEHRGDRLQQTISGVSASASPYAQILLTEYKMILQGVETGGTIAKGHGGSTH